MKAIILGSDRGIQRLDSSKSYPIALLHDGQGKTVLDWTISMLNRVGITDVIFIGGYHIEKVVNEYSGLRFYFNRDWFSSNDVGALKIATRELSDSCLIIRSDILVRLQFMSRLIDEVDDIVVGINSAKDVGKTEHEEPEWAGIVKLSAKAAELLGRQIECTPSESNSTLLELLSNLDMPYKKVDAGDHSARITHHREVSNFVFGTKSETLERLRPIVKRSCILEQIGFTVGEWQRDPIGISQNVADKFRTGKLVVRSSATSEDRWDQSMAGKFRSVLGVESTNASALNRAVNSVIQSFSKDRPFNSEDAVFVQQQIEDVTLSGVVLTRDPETGSPYWIVNYDDVTKYTDTVTSGSGSNLKTQIVVKPGGNGKISDPNICALIEAIKEIEDLSGHDSLDIEFSIDGAGKFYIFQIRPLTSMGGSPMSIDEDFHAELDQVWENAGGFLKSHFILPGKRNVLANMPDWNPAEMIGVCPRPLSASIYRYLITDESWSKARVLCGYTDVSPFPLLVSLAGHTYIDCRVSFNSFIPADVEENLRTRLVDYYLNKLFKQPELQDKVEFEIAVTCADFNFDDTRKRLMDGGFDFDDVGRLQGCLRSHTDRCVSDALSNMTDQWAKIELMNSRRQAALTAVNSSSFTSIAHTVRFLLRDCMTYGTVPFAVMARYSFIASVFLDSLKSRNVIEPHDYDLMMSMLPTVASGIGEDLQKVDDEVISKEHFLEKYGHLRPGTYEITSSNYMEDAATYISTQSQENRRDYSLKSSHEFRTFLGKYERQIASLISESGFSFNVDDFILFVSKTIPAREKLKFEFTKNINAVLTMLVEFGELLDLSRDDMSYIPLEQILNVSAVNPSSTSRSELKRIATLNRKRHQVHQSLKLPPVIRSRDDVYSFELVPSTPNYITQKRVVSEVSEVTYQGANRNVEGRIVFIQGADPGYDWIFGKGISGLITEYGGIASHMSIRSAEMGIPAAIGCGEIIASQVRTGRLIELDCAGHRINVIS